MAAAVLGLGVARRLDDVTVALRLGMGRHDRGQLVFKARGALGYTARRRDVRGANFGAAAVVTEAETRGRKTVLLMHGADWQRHGAQKERGTAQAWVLMGRPASAGHRRGSRACRVCEAELGQREKKAKWELGCSGRKQRREKKNNKTPFLFS